MSASIPRTAGQRSAGPKVGASPSLAFGAGGLHRITTPKRRQRLLQQAFDLGFRSFDVAPAYGNGLNEVELGEAFRNRSADLCITTKFGIPADLYGERYRALFPAVRSIRKYLRGGYGAEYARREFSSAAMIESVHGSLRRLRREHVERLLIHEPLEPIPAQHLAELADHAERLKAQGKIVSFGVCGSGEPVRRLINEPCIEVVQRPIWEAVSEPVDSSRLGVAYGVFRGFQRDSAGRDFIVYVDALRQQLPGIELIVSTTSARTLAGFRTLFS